MPKPVRRIVTTNDENGKSEVLLDGPATNSIASILTELWVTDGRAADHGDRLDHATKSTSLEPPPGGTVFRFFHLPPLSAFEALTDEQRRQFVAQAFAAMNASHSQVDTSKNPAMHQTKTTDYIVVLSGEITLVLDKEERELKPFDVVVQRGTNHAWVNHGSEEALLMAVLVDDKSTIEKP